MVTRNPEDSSLRNRLSILWLSGYAVSLTTIVLEVLSGAKQGVAFGPGYLFALSAISLIGPSMAFLSQVLGGRANRWSNIVMAAVVTVFSAIITVTELVTVPAIALGPAAGVVFAILVVWYAWKSKPRP